MNKIIDFTQDASYDMIVNKNRNLNAYLHCVYVDNGIEYDFDFTVYEVAMLHVKQKPNSTTPLLVLSTINNTIELLDEGRIRFVADPADLNVRAGEYVYDMYLYNEDYTKRQFLSGRFIIQETVTN